MKLIDLNEQVKIGIVSFSELGQYDNWDAKFWVGMNDYIEQHKKLGKDKAVEFVADRVKKIGEENYNTLKNIADKNHFGVPEFKNASNVTKLSLMGSEKIVVLMDLVQAKAAARKTELEKRLKEMQKQIALLGESTDLVENGIDTPRIETLKVDIKSGKSFLKKGGIIKSIKYVSGKYRLVYQGHIDRHEYTYDEILYLIRKENWSYANDDEINESMLEKDDWLIFKVGDKVTPINKYFRGNKDYQEFWSGAEIIDMGINDQDITIQVEKNGKKFRNVQKAFKFKLA